MPLDKTGLADALRRLFESKPASSTDAALGWANAYQSYAGAAISSAASLPVNAAANFGILLGAFQGGLSALASPAAAALVAQGITSYWQAMLWAGPTAAGPTVFPGNLSLAPALGSIFADLGRKSPAEKADELASAFHSGARAVVVSDVLLAPPFTPIVGPIT